MTCCYRPFDRTIFRRGMTTARLGSLGSDLRPRPEASLWDMMVNVAVDRVDRVEAARLLREVLSAVVDGRLAADDPVAVALVRRMEGALLALQALDVATPESGAARGHARRE